MAAGVRIVLAERKSYFNKFLVAIVAEVADETATEKAQKVLPRWAVGDERDGSVGQFHDQFIRVDVVSTEDSVPVADTLQDGQPSLFAVLELQKKRKEKKKGKAGSFMRSTTIRAKVHSRLERERTVSI